MEIRILDSELVKPYHEELTNIKCISCSSEYSFIGYYFTVEFLLRIVSVIRIWNSKFLRSSLLFIVQTYQTIVSFIPVSLFKFLELTPLKFLVVPLTLLTMLWSPDAVVLMRT